MDGLQYNYKGKFWRPCLTAAEGNCFFNSVFGTSNSQDQPFHDKYAKFRRMYWSTFLTYYSGGDLKGTLLDLLQKCFIASDKYQNEDIKKPDRYEKYVQDITLPNYWVLVEEIPLLAALENIRIILFIGDRDTPEVFNPDFTILGEFPFRNINHVREVVICLVDNHFSRLQQYDQSGGLKSIKEITLTPTQDSNNKGSKETPSFTREKHYQKRGGTGIEGSLYQINISTMLLLNALSKVKNWRLSTEHVDAARFDDVIFESLPSKSAILLQAKHKKDESKKITYEDLVSVNFKKEFSLPKYFFSYQEIIKNKFIVKNIVICTNLGLDEDVKECLTQKKLDADSVLHFEGIDNIYYNFKDRYLPDLKQNILDYCAKNEKGKENKVTDKAIDDFITHLQIFPNYLDEKSLDIVKDKTVSKVELSADMDSNLIFKNIDDKMLNWHKEKKGRYLTEVEAKGFFCDIRSNKYCEDLKQYDISFTRKNLPFVLWYGEEQGKKQIASCSKDSKRFFHIIPGKENILNVIKIYQELQLSTEHKTKALFVDPDESADVQRQTIDAFEIEHYTILVIICRRAIEENALVKVMEILTNYEYKHVILIAEETNNLAKRIKDSKYIEYYEVTDSIKFTDLMQSTQEDFKKKKIIHLQGKTMSLEELFRPSMTDDLNQIVDSEMLVKLARNNPIYVGHKLLDLNNYYVYRRFNRGGDNIPEENMWRNEEKVILISDSAGMGKSTVLSSLAIAIKDRDPHLWVVRVDLNNYTNIMKTCLKKGAKTISIIEIINSQVESKLKSEFENRLFLNRERVVLMLDGVDEVCPSYTDMVFSLLNQLLSHLNLTKIIVTTRPHLCEELEHVLKVRSFTLEPFSEENQIDFLTKYWTEELLLQDDRRCKSYAKALIEEMSRWIDDKPGNTFAGIPLQTRMLAEVFQEGNQVNGELRDWEGCKEFVLSGGDKPRLPRRIDLIELYDMFIEKKRDIFINDKSNPGGGPAAEAALNEKFEQCHEFHRSLALETIFYSVNWNLFTCYKDIECPAAFVENYLLRAGIVQSQGNELHFIHRTFAEYFVAQCILIELKSDRENKHFQEFFMDEVLMREDFYVVRAFFDSFVRKELTALSDQTLRSYCDIANTSILASRDTYFHIFAMEGCAGILGFFFKCIDFMVTGERDQEEDHYIYVNGTNLDCVTPLHQAAQLGHLNVVKILLDKGANVNVKDANGATALHMAVLRGHLDVVSFLVNEAVADVSQMNTYGESVLYVAAQEGHLKLVKSFRDRGVDVASEFTTALHAAAYRGHLEVVKFLLDEAAIDVDVLDVNGCTALHAAAQEGHMDVIRLLVERGCNINILNCDSVTAFHAAVYRMNLDVVNFLISQGADVTLEDSDGDNILDVIAMIEADNPE